MLFPDGLTIFKQSGKHKNFSPFGRIPPRNKNDEFTSFGVTKYSNNTQLGFIAIGHFSGKIFFYKLNFELGTFQLLQNFNPILNYNSPVLNIEFSSSGKHMAAAYQSGEICIFDIVEGVQVGSIIQEKRAKGLAFDPMNEHIIAIAGYDRLICIWDWFNQPDFPLDQVNNHTLSPPFTQLVWLNNGKGF